MIKLRAYIAVTLVLGTIRILIRGYRWCVHLTPLLYVRYVLATILPESKDTHSIGIYDNIVDTIMNT